MFAKIPFSSDALGRVSEDIEMKN